MYKYGSDPAIIEWNRNLLATKFIEVVAKQLLKGLLKVNDNQNHKFKLQLPYLYTENTRKKFFPGYEDSNALLDIPEDYRHLPIVDVRLHMKLYMTILIIHYAMN
jgi:hypothetical protein